MNMDLLRKSVWIWILGGCLLILPLLSWGASSPTRPAGATGTAKSSSPPGVELAQTLSTITGIAISPLLGVGAIGCWHYFKCPSGQRHSLSWYAQPWFWFPALILVGLLAAKDVAGTALPPGLKKPVDVAEAIENKISGLVATGAIVPLMSVLLASAAPQAQGVLAGTSFAWIDANDLLQIVATPFALAAYAVVWMTAHAIHVLILLSPWGVVDAILKGFRTALLSALAGIATINPWWGATFSVILIVVSYFLAGWSFRLTVQGWVFCWDFITLRRLRFEPQDQGSEEWAFAANRIGSTPIRSYGRLVKCPDGQLEFRYRPWLFLPEKTERLEGPDLNIGRAFIHPTLESYQDGEGQTILNFPPRYRSHEDALARNYGLNVTEIGVLGGLKWIGRSLKQLLGLAT
jgi:hypothetical protein